MHFFLIKNLDDIVIVVKVALISRILYYLTNNFFRDKSYQETEEEILLNFFIADLIKKHSCMMIDNDKLIITILFKTFPW